MRGRREERGGDGKLVIESGFEKFWDGELTIGRGKDGGGGRGRVKEGGRHQGCNVRV